MPESTSDPLNRPGANGGELPVTVPTVQAVPLKHASSFGFSVIVGGNGSDMLLVVESPAGTVSLTVMVPVVPGRSRVTCSVSLGA